MYTGFSSTHPQKPRSVRHLTKGLSLNYSVPLALIHRPVTQNVNGLFAFLEVL